MLVRQSVNCLSVWVCLMFFSGLNGSYEFWEESHRGEVLSSWVSGVQRSAWLVTDGVDLITWLRWYETWNTYKSRASGGAHGPKWAPLCGPCFPALLPPTPSGPPSLWAYWSSPSRGRLSILSQPPATLCPAVFPWASVSVWLVSPSLEGRPRRAEGWLCSLDTQPLQWCLAHSRCSKNIGWASEWMNDL